MIIKEIEDIIATPDVYLEWHPMIVKRIIEEMKSNPCPTRPKARRKWQEKAHLQREGNHYLVNCHREGGKIVIKGLRRFRDRPKPISVRRR